MSRKFTREQLEAKRDKELKRMCANELGMPGMSKKRKNEVIEAILAKFGGSGSGTASVTKAEKPTPLSGIEYTARAHMSKPNADFGFKTSTTVQVSCGASSGAFPVAGRTVKEVGEFLREVLNVDKLSTGLVNGSAANADYQLKPGDKLEFLKPAGRKG